ncbi:SDR family oxidoreductase [Aminobacter sp. AP02]|uniref:SDR family NAD(P)-dependent oxidoreductase n=1 Tax=Aminobacter sp. AP02 TaxID=2135737 RepID=UPI000D6C8DF3|nr:SDR family oxidoreductase [Aminobacter sp. AP02]PWK75785.1 NAD(P)-dependent dehydrogenase (short-subunit alcohol dehydrogenase family) [Aminobacter sp. AP02]
MRQSAVVIGGASGIGLAVAERLIADGWPVALIDGDGVALAAAEDAIGNDDVVFIETDPTDEDNVAEAFDQVVDSLGLIGGLVAVAGFGRLSSAEDTSAEMLREALDVNLVGPFIAAKAALERMGASLSIVNVGSVAGLRAHRGQIAVASSQAGLKLMAEVFALEFGNRGVRVNAIAAGPTAAEAAGNGGIDRRHMPSGRLAEPEEIAAAVAFLLSPEASYVNGHTLAVDGGFPAAGLSGDGA